MLPVLTYAAPEAAARRAAAGASTRSTRRANGPAARPRRRRVPVADDQRRRSARRLLARRHRRLPHQRRHRRRGLSATATPTTTPTSSATSASSCWSRRRGCGARSATTTPTARFRIDGVTGPDEYSAIADNNVYTNLMAQKNLRAAADAAERHPRPRSALGVDHEETASWRDAAAAMTIPYDEQLGVHPQAEGFTDHEPLGLRGAPRADAVPAAAALPLLRPLPQAGRQAGRPGAGAASLRRRLHRRGEGRATSTTTSR